MTDLSQQIAERQPQKQLTTRDLLRSMEGEFARALPSTLPVERFMRVALTQINQSPDLQRCTAESLLGALVTAAQLGLEPGGPLQQFYLTPRQLQVPGAPKGQRAWQVVPIIGYRGLRDLAYRARIVDTIDAVVVRDGDTYREGSSAAQGGIWHEWTQPEAPDRQRPLVGVLAVATLRGSSRPIHQYLDRQEIVARKDRGAAGDRGPWKSDFEAMSLKTGLRALIGSKLPMSAETATAVAADEQVQTYTVEPGDE